MEFNWLVAAITFLAMVIEAWISYKEETFWRSQRRYVHMTFLWNWAISIGGFVILPIFNAMIVSQLRLELWLYIVGCFFGIVSTPLLYIIWWILGDENKGSILYWETRKAARWVEDVLTAGWLHFVYMVIEIMLMFVYVVSPMSQPVVLVVGVLFLIYVALVNIQANVVQRSFRWSVFIGELAALVVVTAAKL
jgi:hypothetical protein